YHRHPRLVPHRLPVRSLHRKAHRGLRPRCPLRGKGDEFAEFASRPKLSQVVFLLVLPLVLIFANTGLHFAGEAGWVDPESIPVASLRLLGETPIALLITVVIAMWLLGWRQQKGRAMVENVVDSALGPVCSIILITGAGGMFGGVLRASGIGDSLADSLAALGLPVIVAG